MSRELLILRHGKSDWDAGKDDFNRPINDRGKRSAQRVGVWLLGQQLGPDFIVASPAQRAITTAEKTIKAMGQDARGIHPDERIYMADLDALLMVLQDCPEHARRVMLVGHNPGLESLLQYLAEDLGAAGDGKLMPTAAIARLSMPACWDSASLTQGCARLLSLTLPKSLPKKFPFPAPGADEWRKRPAYYYRQSSVIPWQMTDQGLRILLIASSQCKHWVVPKGIQEPGLSPQQSAAKEALEEAGIEGVVDEAALGSYRYRKWGAECTVQVYPMRVEREIAEEQWQESHRGRKWLSPKKAAGLLKQQQLLPLLDVLSERIERG